MTELQKTEFEILCTFVKICEKLELPYFLVCGSALGAVKYGGFIPWDDDVDVGMPRDAYETFLRKAPLLLPKHYFLQNSQTDPSIPMIYSKLRNSNSTYIEKSAANLMVNHGVYIDIFPLDGYPQGDIPRRILEFRKRLYTSQMHCVFSMPRKRSSQYLAKIWLLLGYQNRINKTVAKYTKQISRYRIEDSQIICNHGNWQGKLEYAAKEQYGRGVKTVFEGLQVCVPEDYNAYLTQKYGDWRAELPKEQQVGHHYYTICDCHRPYTYYIKGKENA